MTSITSVQFRPATMLTNGYIQFGILGGNESRGGIHDAVNDENSVIFTPKSQAVADQIKSFVEQKIANRQTGGTVIQQTTSAADELKKFKELLDSGVITQEEFDAKKKQLLGQ